MPVRYRSLLSALAIGCGAVLFGGPLAAQPNGPTAQPDTTATHRGHTIATPALRAVPRNEPIQLDGRLTEPVWRTIPAATDFRQQRPVDGAPSSQRTEVRFLFDDEALYIGARMYDSLGAAGVRTQLARRDAEASSDWIRFVFDTYHDHVGRTMFGLNPSGVKFDAGQASSFADPSWDPVYEAKAHVDSLGWTAEFRIPLSQLRYSREPGAVWGMQIWREVSRLNEISMWSYWSLDENGGPNRFGHLEGIVAGAATRRAEFLPYVVMQHDRLRPGDRDDPFLEQRSSAARIGGDLKYQVSGTLTLNATVNPDFGQVEVDPAVVNLSAFETFFPERRPFFIEGNGIFQFGGLNCYFCSNTSSLSLFYSRRIGRQPQGALPSGTDYFEVPDATGILGAAKLTGRTAGGWSVGVLNAVTGRERARVMAAGVEGVQEVEPLTNYFVGRVRRDLLNGNLNIGLIGTSVVRDLDDPLLRNRLSAHAEAVGLDWRWSWGNRTYSLMGSVAGSNVSGDSTAMLRVQRSSARYFQRPDREGGGNGLFSNQYDPSATRLGGYGLYTRIAKEAGAWLWEASVNTRSPGFEVNDLAFLTRADFFTLNANIFRQFNTPTSWYRGLFFIAGAQQTTNFDGDVTDRQFHGFAHLELLNYWNVGGFYLVRPEVTDDRALRGGPAVMRPRGHFGSVFFNSDRRKAVAVDANFGTGGNTEGSRSYETGLDITVRPSSNVRLSFGPFYGRQSSTAQYVTGFSDAAVTEFYGRRYVVSDLQQDNLSLNTRVNVTFSPTLTLEAFVQPFTSSVQYSRFKEYAEPRTTRKLVYGEDIGTITPVRNSDGVVTRYTVDPDGTGQSVFSLANPNFNYRSIRGNVVLRWEYRPGSTLFLVWTQDRENVEPFGDGLSVRREWSAFGDTRPNNYFLIKVNYWLNL